MNELERYDNKENKKRSSTFLNKKYLIYQRKNSTTDYFPKYNHKSNQSMQKTLANLHS